MADPDNATVPLGASDRARPSTPFGIEETGRRVGHYRWAELRLFEILGGWAVDVPEVDVKTKLGPQCHRHVWHADLWLQRLPALRETSTDRFVVPANDGFVAFVDAVESAETTIEKLAGLYRVFLPHLVGAYSFHLGVSSDITDGPTVRALTLVLRDELEDWRDGEILLQSLIRSPDDVDVAATHQASVEKLIIAAGGVTGPGSTGF